MNKGENGQLHVCPVEKAINATNWDKKSSWENLLKKVNMKTWWEKLQK
jgi:hypothetical protein